MMYRIVDTDNFNGDYPNERFVDPPFETREAAQERADEMNDIAVHLAARQGEDGAWELPPPKNGPPPTWESRETVALLALLAWEPYVSHDAKEAAAARTSREKAAAWLSKTKPTDTTQATALRLLLDVRTGKPAEQVQLGSVLDLAPTAVGVLSAE